MFKPNVIYFLIKSISHAQLNLEWLALAHNLPKVCIDTISILGSALPLGNGVEAEGLEQHLVATWYYLARANFTIQEVSKIETLSQYFQAVVAQTTNGIFVECIRNPNVHIVPHTVINVVSRRNLVQIFE